jgi:4-diphosphocytidyl-2-C-methyl-D-erythritol kinase
MDLLAKTSAYAKINLGLKILGRRPDGYHDILSILQTVDLCDGLTFEEVPEGRIEILPSDPAIPSGEENLIHRAVTALREASGCGRGVRIRLEKVIPAGAGLGGGSADAAATLKALNRAWGLRIPRGRILEMASRIGSDVVFLVSGGTAVVSGRGERIRPVPWNAEIHYVLIQPPFRVSTRWAYEEASAHLGLGLTEPSKYINFVTSLTDSPISARDLLGCLENDFEPVVARAWPELRIALRALREHGADAGAMTGSGSAVYGAFFDAAAAGRAARALRRDGHRVFQCRPRVEAREDD